ncbi:MAG: hypothetical protein KGO96_10640 [Elusimicrobia bacterium]|nr:hypothetical protein [Elusimicrobiota bacterium]
MKTIEPYPRATVDMTEIFADAMRVIDEVPQREAEERERKKREALDALKTLPIEERIARIEEWIADHSEVRHGYVSPPRFGG